MTSSRALVDALTQTCTAVVFGLLLHAVAPALRASLYDCFAYTTRSATKGSFVT
jgi:hypothetical protein